MFHKIYYFPFFLTGRTFTSDLRAVGLLYTYAWPVESHLLATSSSDILAPFRDLGPWSSIVGQVITGVLDVNSNCDEEAWRFALSKGLRITDIIGICSLLNVRLVYLKYGMFSAKRIGIFLGRCSS